MTSQWCATTPAYAAFRGHHRADRRRRVLLPRPLRQEHRAGGGHRFHRDQRRRMVGDATEQRIGFASAGAQGLSRVEIAPSTGRALKDAYSADRIAGRDVAGAAAIHWTARSLVPNCGARGRLRKAVDERLGSGSAGAGSASGTGESVAVLASGTRLPADDSSGRIPAADNSDHRTKGTHRARTQRGDVAWKTSSVGRSQTFKSASVIRMSDTTRRRYVSGLYLSAFKKGGTEPPDLRSFVQGLDGWQVLMPAEDRAGDQHGSCAPAGGARHRCARP